VGQRVVDIALALLGGRTGGDLGRGGLAAVRAPLPDALICLSLGGDAGWLTPATRRGGGRPGRPADREAAAGALSIPAGSGCGRRRRALACCTVGCARHPARAHLAARLLAIAADGLPEELPARAVDG
jgi:hypothetical protein